MNTKTYKIFFVQLLMLSCLKSFGQGHKLDSVKVEFEGFDTETFASVTCDGFDHTFLKTKKVKFFRDKSDLVQFESSIKNFKPSSESSIDVRGKITYYYGAKTLKYCFDVFGTFYESGKLYHNKKLLIAVSDHLYSDHPNYLDTLRVP